MHFHYEYKLSVLPLLHILQFLSPNFVSSAKFNFPMLCKFILSMSPYILVDYYATCLHFLELFQIWMFMDFSSNFIFNFFKVLIICVYKLFWCISFLPYEIFVFNKLCFIICPFKFSSFVSLYHKYNEVGYVNSFQIDVLLFRDFFILLSMINSLLDNVI